MLNIVLFGAAVFEKKAFLKFIKIFLILPLMGPALYLHKSESPSPKHVSHHVWFKLAKWFLTRSRLKGEKRTDGRTNCDGNSSFELKMP